jgi:hypothetical protein
MHDLAHAGLNRGAYEDSRVCHGLSEMGAAMMEADPICVVKDIGAAQAFHQPSAVGELQRRDFNFDVVGPGPIGMVRQCLDPPFLSQQTPRDEATREAERTGHDVESGVCQNGNRVKS